MERPFALLALAALALLGAPCKAQESRSLPAPAAPQPITRQTAARPMPFSAGEGSPAAPLEFRTESLISPQDRALWNSAQTALSQRANAAGLDFIQGPWETRQIVCSALPGHLFLAFTRGDSSHATAFTASIPRGSGQVRVLPILRRGYSLFSPAPINAQTLSAFNHIRAEEHPAQPAEWLPTGLCYAALAGAQPEVGLAGSVYKRKDSTAAPGSLTMTPANGGEISFLDLSANPRHNLWTMSFDPSGRLLKATLTRAPLSRQRVAQRTPTEIQGKPVSSSVEPQGKLVLPTEPSARTDSAQ